MDEALTMEEIEARYPNSWILIDQPELDQYQRVIRGRVVFTDSDRDRVYRIALDLPPPRKIAFHCTKKRQPGMAYIL